MVKNITLKCGIFNFFPILSINFKINTKKGQPKYKAYSINPSSATPQPMIANTTKPKVIQYIQICAIFSFLFKKNPKIAVNSIIHPIILKDLFETALKEFLFEEISLT